jgi:hypothetical protein
LCLCADAQGLFESGELSGATVTGMKPIGRDDPATFKQEFP